MRAMGGIRKAHGIGAAGVAIVVWAVASQARADIVPIGAGGGAASVQTAPAAGVQRVDIAAPNGAGVSHNRYAQFDVGQAGVVLNNARECADTRLAGQVEANPALSGGSARVILNEVLSGAPSQLRGMLEVAGDRADVIVANPSGIACDGCGFINARRGTLVAGTPRWRDGALAGYDVREGTVVVDGAGLNARDTDYTAILAHAVRVGGALWANDLRVTATGGQGPGDASEREREGGAAPDDEYALDVSALGGMYANSIRLIGRRDGLGVRNAGRLHADDHLQITSDGEVLNRGAMTAGDIEVAAKALVNAHGRIEATRSLALAVGDDGVVDNGAGRLLARGHVSIDAGALDNAYGDIRSDTGNVTIVTPRQALNNLKGAIHAGRDISLRAAGVDNAGGTIAGRGGIAIDAQGHLVDNTRGRMLADRTLSVKAGEANNSYGFMLGREIDVALAGELYSVRGHMHGTNGVSLRTHLGHREADSDAHEN
ncbi:tRNA nuclease CdiA-2 [Pandoraea terrae]|uniref:tRNA nuclease CdiA-2 n=2 Tax=Pandoraea terrae TaxID=1537710 RepID=A0A5E4W8A3_9BURK|nr:tRNA nuclease CdiA-2 [Pandoraea terrae]